MVSIVLQKIKFVSEFEYENNIETPKLILIIQIKGQIQNRAGALLPLIGAEYKFCQILMNINFVKFISLEIQICHQSCTRLS